MNIKFHLFLTSLSILLLCSHCKVHGMELYVKCYQQLSDKHLIADAPISIGTSNYTSQCLSLSRVQQHYKDSLQLHNVVFCSSIQKAIYNDVIPYLKKHGFDSAHYCIIVKIHKEISSQRAFVSFLLSDRHNYCFGDDDVISYCYIDKYLCLANIGNGPYVKRGPDNNLNILACDYSHLDCTEVYWIYMLKDAKPHKVYFINTKF